MDRSPQDAKRATLTLDGTSDLLDIGAGFSEELQKVQESPAVTEALLVSGLAFARFPADQLRAFPQKPPIRAPYHADQNGFSDSHKRHPIRARTVLMAIIHSLRKGWLPVFDMLADAEKQNPRHMAGGFVCMVRKEGLEPTRLRRQNLNLVRLPISPLPRRGLGFRYLINK